SRGTPVLRARRGSAVFLLRSPTRGFPEPFPRPADRNPPCRPPTRLCRGRSKRSTTSFRHGTQVAPLLPLRHEFLDDPIVGSTNPSSGLTRDRHGRDGAGGILRPGMVLT